MINNNQIRFIEFYTTANNLAVPEYLIQTILGFANSARDMIIPLGYTLNSKLSAKLPMYLRTHLVMTDTVLLFSKFRTSTHNMLHCFKPFTAYTTKAVFIFQPFDSGLSQSSLQCLFLCSHYISFRCLGQKNSF